MHGAGIVIGAAAFLIIGIFHPIVIKCEYYFTHKVWPLFLVGGLMCCAAAVFVSHVVLSAILAILGFTMLFSIGELKHQAKRVEKGWFPENPRRAKNGSPAAKPGPRRMSGV